MKKSIKKMIKVMTILTIIEFSLALMIRRGFFGVLLGSGGAFFNLYSLWYDIKRMVEMRNARIWKTGYLGRYALSAVIMFIAGLISLGDLFGSFIGLLNLKIATYLSFGGKSGE